MNKNTGTLLISTAFFSILFYQQSFGLNLLLFNAVLLALVLWRDVSILRDRYFLLAAGSALFTAFWSFWYGSTLAILANIFACAAVSGYSKTIRSSLLVTLLFSVVSFTANWVADTFSRFDSKPSEQEGEKPKRPAGAVWLVVIVPLLITGLFFLLYRGSNPLFKNLTDQISFGWFSWAWFFFTILGFWWSYGFFSFRGIPEIVLLEASLPHKLDQHDYSERATFASLGIDREWLSGMVLLVSLNGLLLLVNALDLTHLFLDGGLPEGMGHSEFVHQGTGTLITSIVLAIGIILFYFKGDLNFYPKSGALRGLTYLWVAQNLFMLFSTGYRNFLYIEDYYLTYKRIGVYVYLFLALIGLVLTAWKVYAATTNWKLIRQTSWAFFAVLILSATVNWDGWIASYNTSRALAKGEEPNLEYLYKLSYLTIPVLLEQPMADGSYEQQQLHQFIFQFLEEQQGRGLRSRVQQRKEVLTLVQEWSRTTGKKQLNLGKTYPENLRPLMLLPELEELTLDASNLVGEPNWEDISELRKLCITGNSFFFMNRLQQLTALEELEYHDVKTGELNYLRKMKSIRKLCLRDGEITTEMLPDLLPPSLAELDLRGNKITEVEPFVSLKNLEVLNLAGNPLQDLTPFYRMKHLETLVLPNETDPFIDTVLERTTVKRERYVAKL